MKKNLSIFLISVLCFSSASYSQVVQKGDKLFGGSFSASFFNINGNGPSYNQAGNAGIFPSFAWAIKNDLVLGVKGGISYSRSKTKTIPADESYSNNLSFGPGVFLRKYKPLKDKFGVYFNNELKGYYLVATQKYPGADKLRNTAWGGDFTFAPGVFYKFSDSFLGEANIGGVYASYSGNNTSDYFGVGVSFLQSFNIGFSYMIGKKRAS
jgi:hypothetical protein